MTAAVADLDAARRKKRLQKVADKLQAQSRADNTRRMERQHKEAWEEWCVDNGARPCPASAADVQLYLADLYERAVDGELAGSTISARLWGVARLHESQGVDDEDNPAYADQVRRTLEGIRRDDDVQTSAQQKAGLLRTDVQAMVDELGDGPRELQAAALILVGWYGFMRRSEVAGIDRADLQFEDGGVLVELGATKTDQTGETGQTAWLPRNSKRPELCPVEALEAWLAHLKEADTPASGPVFRSMDRWGNLRGEGADRLSDRAVARTIKRAGESAGLEAGQLSGHSLRRGAAIQALKNGATVAEIKQAGRWKTAEMVMRYAQHHELKTSSASNCIG